MPCLRFPEAVVPTGAVNRAADRVDVSFNADLVVGDLEPSNWTLDVGPVLTATAAAPNYVILMHSAAAAAARVSFSPPPEDVISLGGVRAAGFSNLPVAA